MPTFRGNLRISVIPVIAFALFSAVRDYLYADVPLYALGGNGAVIALCLLLFGLTFSSRFERVWQPVTIGLVWVAMTIMLNSPIVTGIHAAPTDKAPPIQRSVSSLSPAAVNQPTDMEANAPPLSSSQAPRPAPSDQMLLVQLYTLLIFLAAFRLGFIWTMLLNLGLIFSAYWVLSVRVHGTAQNLLMFAERSLLIFFALMLASLIQERLARSAFLANHLLDQERNDERRLRERTEGMLHVLGQAIGGIVHDLGNPLSAVQGGAQMLEQFIDEGESDKASLKELTGIIIDGAELLNYQRVSLMEQTRVLEGKPIPISPQPVSLRRIIEAGTRYQKPKFAAGRRLNVEEGDRELCADEMKLISVFMNLIGNAMKYSDGEIRIGWQAMGDKTVVVIADQGTRGNGITEAQARNLFVAFARLDTHAQVEGTGLGAAVRSQNRGSARGRSFHSGLC